jgi:Tfp pilus assembly protein PilX
MKKISLLTNENGSVIVLALIMLVLLTLLGMAVTRTSSIEVQIASNDHQAVASLYQAESADHYALEITNTWMTNNFLSSTPATAQTPPLLLDIENDGTNDVRIEIRCIENTNAIIGGLSTYANDLPQLRHVGPPPVDSIYGMKSYEIRRYGITATTLSDNTMVQMGTFKVFNKQNL